MSILGVLVLLLVVMLVVRSGPEQVHNAIYILVVFILIIWVMQLLGLTWPSSPFR